MPGYLSANRERSLSAATFLTADNVRAIPGHATAQHRCVPNSTQVRRRLLALSLSVDYSVTDIDFRS
jgi:hypothetical protein